jgi:hypothetical protein
MGTSLDTNRRATMYQSIFLAKIALTVASRRVCRTACRADATHNFSAIPLV